MILSKAAELYFSLKEPVLTFKIKRGLIIHTCPLVMTQTLIYASNVQRIGLKESSSQDTRFLLVRDELDRMLSAYNKKVPPSRTDRNKRFLLRSSGLASHMKFDEFLYVLKERKIRKQFIDRHFIPQVSLIKKVNLPPCEKLVLGSDIFKKILGDVASIKIASSKEVTGVSRITPANLSVSDKMELKEYLALYD